MCSCTVVRLAFCLLAVLTLIATSSASRYSSARRSFGGAAVISASARDERHGRSGDIKFNNFVEYLLSMGASESRHQAHNQVNKEEPAPRPPARPHSVSQTSDDEDMTAGSGVGDDADDVVTPTLTNVPTPTPTVEDERQPDPPSPAYDLDILGYFRAVPREHWSCCMLGKLAGDKGFHCYAGFYAASIQSRNLNRAHNKKMHFHGHDAIPNWGVGLMHTFQRCVATHGDEFHKCCYAATIEKRERQKWSRYESQRRMEEEEREELEEEQEEEQEEQTERQPAGHSGHHRYNRQQNRPRRLGGN